MTESVLFSLNMDIIYLKMYLIEIKVPLIQIVILLWYFEIYLYYQFVLYIAEVNKKISRPKFKKKGETITFYLDNCWMDNNTWRSSLREFFGSPYLYLYIKTSNISLTKQDKLVICTRVPSKYINWIKYMFNLSLSYLLIIVLGFTWFNYTL